MKNVCLFTFVFIIGIFSLCKAQAKNEEDINVAFQNAKKGVYWVLQNIPEKKRLNNDLIADDKLYASVKLEKEINGIKIESTGYYLSNSVIINIYKSYDSLVKEGYLKQIPSD
jgi:hypothetical protein